MHNPSLQQQPRHESAPVIPQPQETSILDWLEQTGRLTGDKEMDIAYKTAETELADLIGGEETDFGEEQSEDVDQN